MPGLLATLGLNGAGFSAMLKHFVNEAKTAGDKIGTSLHEGIGEKLAGFASIAGVEELVRHIVEMGDEISTTSDRLGISTDAVQSWDYALKQSGSSIEAATPFFEKLAGSRKKALEGNADAIASFQKLGVTMDELKNSRLEDIGLKISEAFEGADPQKLIADLREVGGRGAGEMVPAFIDGFSQMVAGAKDAGMVMKEEVVNSLREAADESQAIWTEFTTALAPAVAKSLTVLRDIWHGLNEGVTGITTAIVTGSLKAGEEASQELADKYKEEADAKREAAEKRKKSAGSRMGFEESESKESARKAETEAKDKERLEERLADLKNKNLLDSLSKEEKINELHRQRVELATWLAANSKNLTEQGRLKAQIDLEEMAGKEDAAQRDLNKPKHEKAAKSPDVNQLQRIGAFSAVPPHEAEQLTVAKKSEAHLAGIAAGISKLTRTGGSFR